MNISRNFFSVKKKKKAAASIQENMVTRDKQKEKKSQQKVPRSHRNAKFLYILKRIVFLKAELPINLTKVKLVHDVSLLYSKIVLAKRLVGRYSYRNGSFSTTMLSRQKSHEPSMTREAPTRMPEFQ